MLDQGAEGKLPPSRATHWRGKPPCAGSIIYWIRKGPSWLIPDDLAGERELDLGVVELLDFGTLGERSRHHLGLDDGDAGLPDAMSASHLRVHLLNCTIHGEVPVLLVHVVVAGS